MPIGLDMHIMHVLAWMKCPYGCVLFLSSRVIDMDAQCKYASLYSIILHCWFVIYALVGTCDNQLSAFFHFNVLRTKNYVHIAFYDACRLIYMSS